MLELCTQSATALAAAIRHREVTSVAVVQAHIDRVRAVNPALNAVVLDRFDEALAEARRADERVGQCAPEELPPFHGVPCTIKENFELVGTPQTAGLVAREGKLSTRDATAVARLRAAGAIPIGLTNLSELCMWLESNNRVYGRTGNAYDPGRIAGGSSGGEGSIVGAGASPFGLGADIAGSIRLPAFFNGVFGHKPTGGLVPGTGQFPISQGVALRYLTTGPICRRAEDLMPLLRVLAGPDGLDQGCRAWPLGDPAQVELSELQVLDVQGNGASPVSGTLLQAQSAASQHLRSLGASVRSPKISALKQSFEIWAAMLSEAEPSGTFRRKMQRDSVGALLYQLGLWTVGRSPHTFPAIALGLTDTVGDLMPRFAARTVQRGHALRAQLLELLGERGVMLYPTFIRTAPRHRVPAINFLPYSRGSAYTGLINVMELPSTQVPMGLDKRGLPIGLQVVSRPGNDHLTIAVALELERAFGGWRPPTRR